MFKQSDALQQVHANIAPLIYQGRPRGPCVESPDNLSGPESYFIGSMFIRRPSAVYARRAD